jgi:hypothetical protein
VRLRQGIRRRLQRSGPFHPGPLDQRHHQGLLAPKGARPPGPDAFGAALRAALHVCEDASAYNSGIGLGWSDAVAGPGAADFPDGLTFPEFVIPQPSVRSLTATRGLAAVMLGVNSGYPKPCPAPPLAGPEPKPKPALARGATAVAAAAAPPWPSHVGAVP